VREEEQGDDDGVGGEVATTIAMMSSVEIQNTLTIIGQLINERWEFQKYNEFTFNFKYVANGGIPMSCLAWINPQLEAFFFRVVMQLPVQTELRPAVAELLTRINYPLPNGNFALDYETGDLRFKSGIYFGGTSLSKPLVHNLIASSLEFVDLHVLDIVKLMIGQSSSDSKVDPSVKEIPARPTFEKFIQGYLCSLFVAVGLENMTNEEAAKFQAYLIATRGTQYIIELYNGVHRQNLTEEAMRSAYNNETLRFSASQAGMEIVETFKKEILDKRSG
jgi:hypothetical protein